MNKELESVLEFWFNELTPKDWYSGAPEVDAKITERFSDVHAVVAAGEFADEWDSGKAYLAEVIVLDQFSRNMFRDTAEAFAYDEQALALAQEAIAKGLDTEMNEQEKQFLYMPFMHSESREVHEQALALFEALGNEENLKYEKIHKDIVDRFGRYPHRNEQLGRESTEEEKKYLANNHEGFFNS